MGKAQVPRWRVSALRSGAGGDAPGGGESQGAAESGQAESEGGYGEGGQMTRQIMKAYTVSFTNARPGPGRSHKATYRTACVIAVSPMDAAAKADRYCKAHWPKLHVEEIWLAENVVILA